MSEPCPKSTCNILRAAQLPQDTLHQPIVIVGHGAAGSTLLAALVNWHPMVYPKWPGFSSFQTINAFAKMLVYDRSGSRHRPYGLFIERLRVTAEPSSYEGKRFLYKRPDLCLCLDDIYRRWPDVKVVALFRNAIDSIGSRTARALQDIGKGNDQA